MPPEGLRRNLLSKHSEEMQRRARQAERRRRAKEYQAWSQALLAEQFTACTKTLDRFYGPLKTPHLCEVRYSGKDSGFRGHFGGCVIARYRLEDGRFEYRNVGSGHRAIERFKQRHVSHDEHPRHGSAGGGNSLCEIAAV
jgi:hypothetical protein